MRCIQPRILLWETTWVGVKTPGDESGSKWSSGGLLSSQCSSYSLQRLLTRTDDALLCGQECAHRNGASIPYTTVVPSSLNVLRISTPRQRLPQPIVHSRPHRLSGWAIHQSLHCQSLSHWAQPAASCNSRSPNSRRTICRRILGTTQPWILGDIPTWNNESW
jgi:hypothetical protein